VAEEVQATAGVPGTLRSLREPHARVRERERGGGWGRGRGEGERALRCFFCFFPPLDPTRAHGRNFAGPCRLESTFLKGKGRPRANCRRLGATMARIDDPSAGFSLRRDGNRSRRYSETRSRANCEAACQPELAPQPVSLRLLARTM